MFNSVHCAFLSATLVCGEVISVLSFVVTAFCCLKDRVSKPSLRNLQEILLLCIPVLYMQAYVTAQSNGGRK